MNVKALKKKVKDLTWLDCLAIKNSWDETVAKSWISVSTRRDARFFINFFTHAPNDAAPELKELINERFDKTIPF